MVGPSFVFLKRSRGTASKLERLAYTLLTDFIVNSLAKPIRAGRKGIYSMLDGKRYFAVFPDEAPANEKPILLQSPTLIAALRALEKELRPFIPTAKAND